MTLPPNEWMPVFAVAERRRSKREAGAGGGDELHRVGTAWRNDDGSYLVSLTALPPGGELLIRPPRVGDALYPAHGRECVDAPA